jgi:hypothetical protein
MVIDSIAPLDIVAVLPPPAFPGVSFQPRGGNLSFYRPQSEWLDHPSLTILPFADYEAGLREVAEQFAADGASIDIPQLNVAAGLLQVLSMEEAASVRAYYKGDV